MTIMRTRRLRTLPLGIDLGAHRVRVALAHRDESGRVDLLSVASRATGDNPAAALADAVAELRTHERRCVFALGEPRAHLARVRLPSMRRGEQERAARFEATRFVDYPIDEAIVRVMALGANGDTVIGVVRKDVMGSLVAIAHAAKLRVSAVDNETFAFRRALPHADAVLDIGSSDSRLHVFTGAFPIGRRFPIGGADFSTAVGESLGCDFITAERRKVAHGVVGCAESKLLEITTEVATALADCRANGLGDVRNIALVGNGSRIAELAGSIERAAGVRVRPAELDANVSQTLPADVIRAASPDWCLAYGLALWSA